MQDASFASSVGILLANEEKNSDRCVCARFEGALRAVQYGGDAGLIVTLLALWEGER